MDNTAIPEHCPGTQSEDAGKASSCAGCPNQQICSSGILEFIVYFGATNYLILGDKGPDPNIELVKNRLAEVKVRLLILSGKGGVGKSTVTSLVSRTLAHMNPDQSFGVLDIDICGPSQPRVLGVQGKIIVLLADIFNKLNFKFRRTSTPIWFRMVTSFCRGQFESDVYWFSAGQPRRCDNLAGTKEERNDSSVPQ